jgi:hypothetical protein
MYPRTNYEMTEGDLKTLMDAARSVPMIALQCGTPSSQQENANNAWEKLGKKMGFDHMTVKPAGGGDRFFTAIPSENEDDKKIRIEKETDAKKLSELIEIQSDIDKLESRKSELENEL